MSGIISPLTNYLSEVEKYLPYGKYRNEELIATIQDDLEELDAGTDYYRIYGLPEDVAKNIASTQLGILEPAGWTLRFIALMIDVLVMGVAMIIVTGVPYFLFFGFSELDPESLTGMDLFGFIMLAIYMTFSGLFVVSYLFWSEKLNGTTIGKSFFGMRVIHKSGIKINWTQTIVRNIVKVQGEFLWLDVLLGILMAKEHGPKRRATEIASDTLVVYVR